MTKPNLQPKATQAHTRQKPAQGVLLISGQSTIVFITVCTTDRGRCLATAENHDALVTPWRGEAAAWLVGRYVLMPDHMHFFAAPYDETCKLETWLRFWKRRFGQLRGLPPNSLQDGKWDTRMRSATQYQEKWDYVRENPVRQGLVGRPEDWPYSGEVYELRW